MKKEIQETACITIKTDAKQAIEIRTKDEWCFIDWGDCAFSPGGKNRRIYRKRGIYEIFITAKKLEEVHILGQECRFAKFNDCHHLKRLVMNDVGLMDIEFNGCKELRYVSCENNRLTALNFYDSPRLHTLECGYNLLMGLTLWRTFSISRLKCNNNQLKELNLPGKNSLIYLDCSHNLLAKNELNKIFSKLQPCTFKDSAIIKCKGNPGFTCCNVKRIIAKGWDIGRDKRLTA